MHHAAIQDLNWKAVSALDVLSLLLETNQVSDSVVQAAHQQILKQQSSSEKANKNEKPLPSNQKQKRKQSDDKKTNDNNDIQTRHIALCFAYDGAPYSGLAQNMGVETDNSVEKALFQALLKARLVTSREDCQYSRCGRTDRGVSAAGQVVALQLKSAFSPHATLDEAGTQPVRELPRSNRESLAVWVPPRKPGKPKVFKPALQEYPYDQILNKLLASDISILGWTVVSDDFSARFSATTRTYRYFFVKRNYRHMQAMQEAIGYLIGKHDFRNFCKMDVEKVYNFERTIYSASVESFNDTVGYFLIHGQAFLWHQIRCIASILFVIGQGLEAPELVKELLNVSKYPGKPAYPLAPERPLVLHDCGYHQLHVQYSVTNLWMVLQQQWARWDECILEAARIQNLIQAIAEKAVVHGDDVRSFCQQKKSKKSRPQDEAATASDLSDVSLPETMMWGEALEWMDKHAQLRIKDPLTTHIPILQRSFGSTYEQKVASVQKSDRRRVKYRENVIKKRKTQEEDTAFYTKMTNQGSL